MIVFGSIHGVMGSLHEAGLVLHVYLGRLSRQHLDLLWFLSLLEEAVFLLLQWCRNLRGPICRLMHCLDSVVWLYVHALATRTTG